ncbi:MAG: PilZ domain-containing protein [Polyangiaceae bacterium]
MGSGTGSGSGSNSNRARASGPFRAHARRNTRLRALMTHLDAGWQRHVTIENVSLGGARVIADAVLAPGDAVTVSFTAPTLWDPLLLRARVAWITPRTPGEGSVRAGLSFDHKTGDAVFALYELIVTLGYE